MKKSLLISVFATLAMMISLNALAQEKATGKAYKAIQKDEKVIKIGRASCRERVCLYV